jgi:hypothetical protein
MNDDLFILGMYYPAFGSSAALHLNEQYCFGWLDGISKSEPSTININDHRLRIVQQNQSIGDNEDEFYLSPRTQLQSLSCSHLEHQSSSMDIDGYDGQRRSQQSNNEQDNESQHQHQQQQQQQQQRQQQQREQQQQRQRRHSLTTLDNYRYLHVTPELLEQIWHSLLNLAISEHEVEHNDLNEYRIQHIIGLTNQSLAIEKSHSYNDIFLLTNQHSTSIEKKRSKSFDVTSLFKHCRLNNDDSGNMGLLQGIDISEPFADRLLSTSIMSDMQSIPSIVEHEPLTANIDSSALILEESLNSSQSFEHDEFECMDNDVLSTEQTRDTYAELFLFRPHSLSTIPSSRASPYASSIDSDDLFERERYRQSDYQDSYHPSDDDDHHGMFDSKCSSPQSRPLSSIQSRSLSPDAYQVSCCRCFSLLLLIFLFLSNYDEKSIRKRCTMSSSIQ